MNQNDLISIDAFRRAVLTEQSLYGPSELLSLPKTAQLHLKLFLLVVPSLKQILMATLAIIFVISLMAYEILLGAYSIGYFVIVTALLFVGLYTVKNKDKFQAKNQERYDIRTDKITLWLVEHSESRAVTLKLINLIKLINSRRLNLYLSTDTEIIRPEKFQLPDYIQLPNLIKFLFNDQPGQPCLQSKQLFFKKSQFQDLTTKSGETRKTSTKTNVTSSQRGENWLEQARMFLNSKPTLSAISKRLIEDESGNSIHLIDQILKKEKLYLDDPIRFEIITYYTVYNYLVCQKKFGVKEIDDEDPWELLRSALNLSNNEEAIDTLLSQYGINGYSGSVISLASGAMANRRNGQVKPFQYLLSIIRKNISKSNN